MQNMMEEEDHDGLEDDLDSDSSNEFDDSEEDDTKGEVPIPSSWDRDLSDSITLNDHHNSAREYHVNNISTGATYYDKRHMQEEITQWQ
jgi:hypothetical protein